MSKVRHFEASHWSIPYNSLCIFYSITEKFFCFWSDVHSFPAIRNASTFYNLDIAVVREVITDSVVNRKKKFNTFFFCFL